MDAKTYQQYYRRGVEDRVQYEKARMTNEPVSIGNVPESGTEECEAWSDGWTAHGQTLRSPEVRKHWVRLLRAIRRTAPGV